MLKAGKACKAIPDKLKLLQRGLYYGHKMFHDKYKNHPEHLPLRKSLVFQCYQTLVNTKQAITAAELM